MNASDESLPVVTVSLAQLKKQEVARIVINDTGVLVIAGEGGQVYAIKDLCPHAEASMYHGSQAEGAWTCPWHGATFDLTTGECRMDQPTCREGWSVKVYSVTVDGDEVRVTDQP